MSGLSSPCIAVLAVGTRGDVQPLLALAIALQDTIKSCAVTVVTHKTHQAWLREPAESAGVRLQLIGSAPVGVRVTARAQATEHEPQDADVRQEGGAAAEAAANREQLREELVAACEAALGSAINMGHTPAACNARTKLQPLEGQRLILFNLFALEGFSIAEALRVPCAAVSPCLVPYAMPASFERRFQQAHTQLYWRLRAADELQRQQLCGSSDIGGQGSDGSVGWSEVRHWLWPLFMESCGAWRHHRLGLSAVPYADCPYNVPLPPPPPLLYGVSELVVPRPGYWPATVRMCGYWASMTCFPASQQQLPASVLQVLGQSQEEQGAPAALAGAGPEEARQRLECPTFQAGAAAGAAGAPICVDFGSSTGPMGLLPRPQLLLDVLRAAAQRLQRRVLLLTSGWRPLLEACSCQPGSSTWVHPVDQPVPHDLLLPHCAALLHHGGAGSVAAALRCGTPQLVCPLHFDQHQWAERIAWLGCGAHISPAALLQTEGADPGAARIAGGAASGPPAPPAAEAGSMGQQQAEEPHLADMAGHALAATLAGLLQDASVKEQCAAMRRQLAGERGLAAAVELIGRHLEQHAALPSALGAGKQEVSHVSSSPFVEVQPAVAAVQELQLPDGLRIHTISPPEALFIHHEVFVDDCYHLTRGITLTPGSIVVDAGANIGLFVLRLLLDPHLAPAVHQLYAFEPLPPTADVLEANLRQHGVADKVDVLRCGLHSRPDHLAFTFYPAMPGNSTTLPAEKWEHQRAAMAAVMGAEAADRCFQRATRIECPVITLADFVKEKGLDRIDLLKVDVEGCELEVLRGMDAASWAATSQVVVEVHDVGNRLAAVRELLEGQGFVVEGEPGPGSNWLLFGQRSTNARHAGQSAEVTTF